MNASWLSFQSSIFFECFKEILVRFLINLTDGKKRKRISGEV